MENPYSTLRVLADAVKELPKPSAYRCTPRELILRCSYDWATIYAHLLELERDGLVEMSTGETLQFSITPDGLEKAAAFVAAEQATSR